LIRLLLYVKGFPPCETGGPVEVAYHLVRGLLQNREIRLVLVVQTDCQEEELRKELDADENLVILRLPYFPTLREFKALRSVVRSLKHADIVHFNEFPFRHLPLVLIAKIRGIPIVFSLHGLVSREIHTFLGPAYAVTIGDGDVPFRIRMPWTGVAVLSAIYGLLSRTWTAVVSPSEALKRAATSFEKFDPERIVVIPHGTETPRVRPSSPGPGDGGFPRVLFVGKLETIKGPDLLFAALERLREAGTIVHVSIVGTGSLEAGLKSWAPRLQPQRITFYGTRRGVELESLYASSDIVVIPSREESLSLVALEAMAAGRPIVATNVGGIPEIVRDRRNGLLVAPTAGDLASGIRSLVEHPEERAAMSEANLADARQRPWPEVVARYVRLYSMLVSSAQTSSKH
jgi:glycosyltransferase involved in cell wall biosynthesis